MPSDRFNRWEPVPGAGYVVDDAVTGLTWQGCLAGRTGSSCTGTAGSYTWEAAFRYCEALVWVGHSDWYLPNPMEWLSLTDFSRYSPATYVTPFPGTLSAQAFTSATNSQGVTGAWVADLYAGGSSSRTKTFTYYVRCVRDP